MGFLCSEDLTLHVWGLWQSEESSAKCCNLLNQSFKHLPGSINVENISRFPETNKKTSICSRRKYKYKKLGAWSPISILDTKSKEHEACINPPPQISRVTWLQASRLSLILQPKSEFRAPCAHTPLFTPFPSPGGPTPGDAANTRSRACTPAWVQDSQKGDLLSPTSLPWTQQENLWLLLCSFWVIFTALLYSQKWEGCW